MAGKGNTFSILLIVAAVLCLVALALQVAGLSTDYMRSITTQVSVGATTIEVKTHSGLWKFCKESAVVNECYNLVDSDNDVYASGIVTDSDNELYVRDIVGYPSLLKLFQAMQMLGVILLAITLVLIMIQLCCIHYTAWCVGAAVILSVLAGFFILVCCISYGLIQKDAKDAKDAAVTAGITFTSKLDYSFILMAVAGCLAVICAICLVVARFVFRVDVTRPVRYPVDTLDGRASRSPRYDEVALPEGNSYQKPYRESRKYDRSYDDRRPYHVTAEQYSQPPSYATADHVMRSSRQSRW